MDKNGVEVCGFWKILAVIQPGGGQSKASLGALYYPIPKPTLAPELLTLQEVLACVLAA